LLYQILIKKEKKKEWQKSYLHLLECTCITWTCTWNVFETKDAWIFQSSKGVARVLKQLLAIILSSLSFMLYYAIDVTYTRRIRYGTSIWFSEWFIMKRTAGSYCICVRVYDIPGDTCSLCIYI
jgi:hypothetical protein